MRERELYIIEFHLLDLIDQPTGVSIDQDLVYRKKEIMLKT